MATATVVAIPLTPTAQHTVGAIHTTVDTVGVTDGIMMDGVMAADGVMKVTRVMVAANTLSLIQDMAKDTITADRNGHRISRTIV